MVASEIRVSRSALLEEAAQLVEGLQGKLGGNETRDGDELATLLRNFKDETARFGQPRTKCFSSEEGQIAVVDFPLTLFPRAGWCFDRLECILRFNPDANNIRRPVIHDLFPKAKSEEILKLSVDGALTVSSEFKFAAVAAPALNSASGALHADIVFPLRDYVVRNPVIEAAGQGDYEAMWRLDDVEYLASDAPRLAVVVLIPRDVALLRVKAELAACRSFNLWGARLGDVVEYLSDRLRTFFESGAPLTDQAEWDLSNELVTK